MYGKSIHCMVHASTVPVMEPARLTVVRRRRGRLSRRGVHCLARIEHQFAKYSLISKDSGPHPGPRMTRSVAGTPSITTCPVTPPKHLGASGPKVQNHGKTHDQTRYSNTQVSSRGARKSQSAMRSQSAMLRLAEGIHVLNQSTGSL